MKGKVLIAACKRELRIAGAAEGCVIPVYIDGLKRQGLSKLGQGPSREPVEDNQPRSCFLQIPVQLRKRSEHKSQGRFASKWVALTNLTRIADENGKNLLRILKRSVQPRVIA